MPPLPGKLKLATATESNVTEYFLRPEIQTDPPTHWIGIRGFFTDNEEMARVQIEEIQRNLSGYLARVEAGETIVIIREGKPVAEIQPAVNEGRNARPYGLCKGEFRVPDDFDAPLPQHILEQFDGK
jgi:prevent-host-death family protein